MRTTLRIYPLAVASFLLVGCLERAARPLAQPAQAAGGKYFAVEMPPNPLTLSEKGGAVRIGIRTAMLGKEFLFQGSVVSQDYAPRFHGLRSRIVYFQDQGDSVCMMEAVDGYTVTPSLKQNLVLAKFPLSKREGDFLFFDFAAGMQKLYTSDEWTGQDLTGSEYSSGAWNHVTLLDSFVQKAIVEKEDQLVIQQVGQVSQLTSKDGSYRNEQVNLHYYLSAYVPHEAFVPTLSPGLDHVGFFETAPRLKPSSGTSQIHAVKFDITQEKKISFAISSNTPPEFRQAITDGILYWNKSFGREVLQVVPEIPDAQAPNILQNLVQWVPWDTAGSAYADAQVDPRTGEILHAQIFLTSAFSFSGRKRALQLLPLFLNQKEAKKTEWISLPGFQKKPLCVYELQDTFLSNMAQLVAIPSTTDAQILRVTQDYLREVVAHEVGHTLGFRHNFAASLAANFSPQQRKSLYHDYILADTVPTNLLPASSVMDYLPFEEATWVGALIRSTAPAFPYDRSAVSILYEGNRIVPTLLPLFCTDSHVGKFADCNRFDSGSNPVESAYWKEKEAWERLPHNILWHYIEAKTQAGKGAAFSITQATLDPLLLMKNLYAERKTLLGMFKEGTQFLSVHRSMPYFSSLNQEEIEQKNQEAFAEFWKSHSVASVFSPLSLLDISHAQQAFTHLLKNYQAHPKEGEAPLYEEEVSAILAEMEKVFLKLPTAALQVELDMLSNATQLMQHPLSDELAALFKDRAAKVILAGQIEIGAEIPYRFTYPLEVRLKAAGLLKKKSADLTWGATEMVRLRAEVKLALDRALGGDCSNISLDGMSRGKERWILETRKLLQALGVETTTTSS